MSDWISASIKVRTEVYSPLRRISPLVFKCELILVNSHLMSIFLVNVLKFRPLRHFVKRQTFWRLECLREDFSNQIWLFLRSFVSEHIDKKSIRNDYRVSHNKNTTGSRSIDQDPFKVISFGQRVLWFTCRLFRKTVCVEWKSPTRNQITTRNYIWIQQVMMSAVTSWTQRGLSGS